MSDKFDDMATVTIKFTDQQMELVNKLAKESGKSVSECVADALEDFVRKEGSRYSR